MPSSRKRRPGFGLSLGLAALACLGACPAEPIDGHGPVAEDISGRLGDPLPEISDHFAEVFVRGQEVAEHRFTRSEGLGPAFNVSFCAGCHERPVTGGSAGLYRNFAIAGQRLGDGSFLPAKSAGEAGGVVRVYYYGEEFPARPDVAPEVNVVGQRNPIPFFGTGLLAELSTEEAILSRNVDEEDGDGDGISGRANYDRGLRRPLRPQVANRQSIEGFIRGPLFNHLGLTSGSAPQRGAKGRAFPVPSSSWATGQAPRSPRRAMLSWSRRGEAGAGRRSRRRPPSTTTTSPIPELADGRPLRRRVAFSMLLAAPQFDLELHRRRALRGQGALRAGLNCGRLPRRHASKSPRGPVAALQRICCSTTWAPSSPTASSMGLASG